MDTTNISSGYNTPDSQLDGVLSVHPTAVRRPNYITVQSENTLYDDKFITSKFYNRGANVTITEGQLNVVPKAEEYQFRTKKAVSKTGSVHSLCLYTRIVELTDLHA
jgi:myo-inositol-1-phosphate synthase